MDSKLNEYWNNIHQKYNSTYDGWINKYVHLFHKEDYIVELGCGRAYCSRYLYDNGFKNITCCDFSGEILKYLNKEHTYLKTMLFDMSDGLPFDSNSINVIIADLCLHYFNYSSTEQIFKEINRVLTSNGYLIARVNSTNDKLNIPQNSEEIEKNFYYDGNIYKRFFESKDFEALLKNFEICSLEEKSMDRYAEKKILWEICAKKV